MSRVAPAIHLDPGEKTELMRVARAPSTPQALAQRARLVLYAARGYANQRIARALRLTPATVGKWRTRFAFFGLPGLRGYPSGRPIKYGPEAMDQLRRLLSQPPPDGMKRWSVRSLARELEMPRSTVHDMLRALYHPRRR